jgi:hypothetical protein
MINENISNDPIYGWTNSLFSSPIALQSLQTLRDTTARLWTVRGLSDLPIISPSPNENCAATDGYTIWLPFHLRTTPILLHEIAHVFTIRDGHGYRHCDHFMENIFDLYGNFFGFSVSDMKHMWVDLHK